MPTILNNLDKQKFDTMEALELKSNIYKTTDSIQNEQILQSIYNLLKTKDDEKEGSIWTSLNEEQKQEVMLAFEESEDEENWVDAKLVFKR